MYLFAFSLTTHCNQTYIQCNRSPSDIRIVFLNPFPWRGHATLLTTAGIKDSDRTAQDASDPKAPDQAAYSLRSGQIKRCKLRTYWQVMQQT